jgi:hypothetical protein
MPAGTFLPPGLTTSDVKITSGGTNNYVMTAVDGETIQGESALQFDGTNLGIGPAHTVDTILHIESADPNLKIQDSSGSGDGAVAVVSFYDNVPAEMGFIGMGSTGNSDIYLHANAGDLRLKAEDSSTVLIEGVTPTLTIGDAGDEDAGIVFAGHGATYHIGFDSGTDDLIIGTGTTFGGSNTQLITVSSTETVFNEDQVDHDFRVEGNDFANMIMVDASRNTMGFFIGASNNYGAWFSQGAHQPDDGADYSRVRMNAQAPVTINTSTTSSYVDTLAVQEPIITAAGDGSSGTVTIASSLRIQSAPTEAPNADSTIQNNYGLYVQSGMTRLTEGAIIGNTNDLNQQLDDSTHGDGTVTLYIGTHTIDVTDPSDEILKENIRDTSVDSLSVLEKLKLRDFNWKKDNPHYGHRRETQFGMVAQEVQEIMPELVREDSEGILNIQFNNMVPYLVKAIQELSEKLETQLAAS